jgi:hypothetical protein
MELECAIFLVYLSVKEKNCYKPWNAEIVKKNIKSNMCSSYIDIGTVSCVYGQKIDLKLKNVVHSCLAKQVIQ